MAGKHVGELVVDSIERDPGAGRDVGAVHFRGGITLSGTTMRHPEADLALTTLCFEADSASAARLPRWEGDERRPWFCFENTGEAARSIGPIGKIVPVSVVIDRFRINRRVSDDVNSARLVRVLARPARAE